MSQALVKSLKKPKNHTSRFFLFSLYPTMHKPNNSGDKNAD